MNSPQKILIAEDEVHIAKAIVAILKKGLPGFIIDHAKNGADAWEKAKSGTYQIIISDWNMPKKNGDELLSDLRCNENTVTTPFIMLTAKGDKDSYEAALEAGANGYVVKPFKTPEFIAKVKGVLDINGSACVIETVNDSSPIELVIDKFKQGYVKLPVLPEVVVKVSELFERGEVAIDELARVVELDAAIASQLISVANSPLVRGSSDCISVDRAITRLGLDETKSYVVALSHKGMLVSENWILKGVLEDLWWHSLAIAYCAKILARELDHQQPEKLFLFGLLHDIGKLLLVSIVDDLSKSNSCFDEPAVKGVMQKLHSDFGAVLLKEWKYNDEFQNIAQYHHVPFSSNEVSVELLIVYLANLMVSKIGFAKDEAELANVTSSQAATKLGVSNKMITSMLEEANACLLAVKQVL